MPTVPRNAHRRTQLFTKSPFAQQQQQEQQEQQDITNAPQIPEEYRKSVFVPAFKTLKAMKKANNNYNDNEESQQQDLVAELKQQLQQQQQYHPLEQQEQSDGEEGEEVMHLALVLFDYPARAPDDLNVLEGDIVRVIAIEGEWMYGLLLQPAGVDNDEYVPAEMNGVPQVGWLPVSFTTSIQ
jgi:hypothetical protein